MNQPKQEFTFVCDCGHILKGSGGEGTETFCPFCCTHWTQGKRVEGDVDVIVSKEEADLLQSAEVEEALRLRAEKYLPTKVVNK